MNWEKFLGVSVPITGVVVAVFLVILGFQFPKINKTSEDVAVLKFQVTNLDTKVTGVDTKITSLEDALGTAPAELRANADQLGKISRSFQDLESKYIAVSTNLQTAQTALSQSVTDIRAVRNDVKALDKKITSIEGNLNNRLQKIEVQLTKLNESALGVDKVLDRRFSSFEKELLPKVTDLNKKVDEIYKTIARPPSKNTQ